MLRGPLWAVSAEEGREPRPCWKLPAQRPCSWSLPARPPPPCLGGALATGLGAQVSKEDAGSASGAHPGGRRGTAGTRTSRRACTTKEVSHTCEPLVPCTQGRAVRAAGQLPTCPLSPGTRHVGRGQAAVSGGPASPQPWAPRSVHPAPTRAGRGLCVQVGEGEAAPRLPPAATTRSSGARPGPAPPLPVTGSCRGTARTSLAELGGPPWIPPREPRALVHTALPRGRWAGTDTQATGMGQQPRRTSRTRETSAGSRLRVSPPGQETSRQAQTVGVPRRRTSTEPARCQHTCHGLTRDGHQPCGAGHQQPFPKRRLAGRGRTPDPRGHMGPIALLPLARSRREQAARPGRPGGLCTGRHVAS